MDGAEVASNCLCSVRSCATCWCPDSELADAHRGECHYRRMAEVMEQLDAARDELLDDEDELVGRVKDVTVKEVEKRLRQSWQSGLGGICRTSWDKTDKRAAACSGWTPAELNNILQAHVVDGALTTFGCVEWESDLFRGTMRARCYPFDMPKRRFHSLNTKVCHSVLCTSYLHIPHSLWYILGYTKLYLVYTIY